MKRIFLAIIALLSLMAGFAQLQDILPISVQRFMDERADRERLSRLNKSASSAYESQFAPTRFINGIEMVDAFIGFDNRAVISTLKSQGVIVNCEFDGFVTAQVPVSKLAQISKIPGVTELEISRMVELATDSTMSVTHAGQVLNGTEYGLPQDYDGSGVIIGIIDTGFDYQHLTFKRADDPNRTRIVRVYDPVDSTGHPVMIGENTLSGTVFMDEQIDTMTYNSGTHGTHVASIAAGKHVGGYGGMAPGADIVLCACRNLNVYLPETEVINCIKYIYSYADSVGKPCVISVSVSTAFGPHDGNDWLSRAVSQLTGPGRIFVIAAGNTGYRSFYNHGPSTLDRPLNIVMGCPVDGVATDYCYYYRYTWLDIWVRMQRARPVVQFHIFDNYTKRIVWKSDLITIYKKIDSSQFSQYFAPDPSVDSEGYLSALVSQSSSSKYELQAYAYNLKTKSYTKDANGTYFSRYKIGVTVYPPKIYYPKQTDSIYVDSWAVQGDGVVYGGNVYDYQVSDNGDTIWTPYESGFYCWPSDYCSIGTYAVHDSIISAGAFVGRNSYYSWVSGSMRYDDVVIGDLYNVSSYEAPGFGPTGKALPTVMAPGFDVVAAGSRYSYFNTTWHPHLVMKTDDGYLWGVMSGTSMAAPTVAGIIAQWLQLNPELSPGDVKQIIAETAIKDSFTQNSEYGFRFGPNGKIDAMAGIRYILNQMGMIVLGDVNGNGFVDISDVVLFISFLSEEGGEHEPVINRLNSDIDQNGKINFTDLRILINYLSTGLGL